MLSPSLSLTFSSIIFGVLQGSAAFDVPFGADLASVLQPVPNVRARFFGNGATVMRTIRLWDISMGLIPESDFLRC